VIVNEHPLPVVNLGADTTICHFDVIVLDAGAGQSAYLWNTSATTQSISVDAASVGVGAHTYSVVVTDAYDCTGTDEITITVEVCGGVGSVGDWVKVYPNPFHAEFTIVMPEGGFIARVFDAKGALITQSAYPGREAVIDLGAAPSGLYELEITSEFGVSRVKLVKD
jgi:hypothetical protein